MKKPIKEAAELHERELATIKKVSDRVFQVRYQNFCLVGTFAKRMGVSSQAVEKRIWKGEIIPIYIGVEKTRLIHWPTYKNFKFKKQQS